MIILCKKRDRNGCLGLSCLQKITPAFMMISQGVATNFVNHYIKIGESTVIESLRRFVRAVVEVFGGEYLRSPNNYDTARLLSINKRRGFSGMLGSGKIVLQRDMVSISGMRMSQQ
jgi:hypothetical protein